MSQLLGHKSIKSTEIYTNVLTADGGHFFWTGWIFINLTNLLEDE